ncbi:MAG: putative alpha,6-mannanase [Chthonomonadaceae bacterium]|nr:putative alpha,6-mannanase [Chthonomonadaceae bacterium]
MQHTPKSFLLHLSLLLSCLFAFSSARAQSPADCRTWGMETLNRIETDFALPSRHLYADVITPGQPAPDRPAFMWGCGVELSALVAASQADGKTWKPRLHDYFTGMEVYWENANGISGYNVLPAPSSPDRYYDDNEWIVIALCDAYSLTKDRAYRDRAEETMRFVLSGEDDKAGGVYWREEKKSKNTCSNGPAIVGALRLYQETHKRDYLDTALRLYRWTNQNLQDTDGLYFDNVNANGKLDKMKWTYNTALMLRANCQFYKITHDKAYLTEAERIAKASEAHWIRSDTGGIADPGMFAHLLCEAFLALHQIDHDPHWHDVVQKALLFVHDKVHDAKGYYGERWERPAETSLPEPKLIFQASAARAFLVFANGGP